MLSFSKVPQIVLRQTMGHKNIANTLIYAHASDQMAAKEAQRATMEIF